MLLSPLLPVAVFAVGVLIGGVGIGGVLLVPTLKYMGGLPLHEVIPACVLSYIATGAVGAVVYARHGTIRWSPALKICAGGLPGAYLGAALLPHVSAFVLEFAIAVLLLASGACALWRREAPVGDGRRIRGGALAAVGFFTGVGSALTGTGGPLLLMPVLLWCRLPVLAALGLAQVIQIPISATATLGNLVHGQVNLMLGLKLALVLTAGAVLGAKLAHVLPVALLRKLVAAVLTAVGLFMLLQPGFWSGT